MTTTPNPTDPSAGINDDTNAVLVSGTLTAAPELKYSQAGTPIAILHLSSSRTLPAYGNRPERTETTPLEVTAFGKVAEACAQYLSAGAPVLIEARLQTDTWQGKDGTERSRLKIIAWHIRFLGPRTAADADAASSPSTPDQPPEDPDVPF